MRRKKGKDEVWGEERREEGTTTHTYIHVG